jgi:hypothetical protein
MTERYFAVATPEQAIYDGRHQLNINLSTATYNGYLVALEALQGSLILATGSPLGQLYEFMSLTELPASVNLATYMPGHYTNMVTGVYEAFVGKDLFEEGTVPTVGDAIYAGTTLNYLLNHTAGSTRLGTCMQTGIYVQHKDGQQQVALCYFDFTSVI